MEQEQNAPEPKPVPRIISWKVECVWVAASGGFRVALCWQTNVGGSGVFPLTPDWEKNKDEIPPSLLKQVRRFMTEKRLYLTDSPPPSKNLTEPEDSSEPSPETESPQDTSSPEQDTPSASTSALKSEIN